MATVFFVEPSPTGYELPIIDFLVSQRCAEEFEVKVLAGVVPEVGFDEEEAPDAAVDAVNRDNAFNLGGEDAPAGGPAASDVGQVPAPLRRSGARRVVTTDDNHVGGGEVGPGSNDSVGMNVEFAD